jgi:hypothetical protein
MQYHDSTSTAVREEVVHAVTVYAHQHAVRCVREVAPGAYALRHRHDTDGHRDERVFLAAIAAHPAVARVERTTHAEDEMLGVDALVTVRGWAMPVPIDVTTRGRGCHGYIANLLATLGRGVVPVVLERVPPDLAPAAAFAAFAFWWQRSEAYFRAQRDLLVAVEAATPADR